MSAAVEQVPPPVFVDIDIEADDAIITPAPGVAAAPAVASSARRERQQAAAIVGEEVVDIESGAAVSLPGGPPSNRSASGTFSHGDALALLLGLVSVVRYT